MARKRRSGLGNATSSVFSKLGRDLSSALSSKDCRRAQVIAAKMRVVAVSSKERDALYKASRKVANCAFR